MPDPICYAGPRIDLAEDPDIGVWKSATESVRFIRERCLTTYNGHACVASNFVNPEGEAQLWHEFGPLEGPGWAANTVGGALELYRFGQFTDDAELMDLAVSLLDHILDDGFIDYETGFILGYRDIVTDTISANYPGDDTWFCPGSMARVAHQLLTFADVLGTNDRAAKMRQTAVLCVNWVATHVHRTDNGWWPRFCSVDGTWTRTDDEFFDASGDSLFILDLFADLIRLGDDTYRELLSDSCDAFVNAGGLFASINHDTYDSRELVSYAVAYQALCRAADVLGRPELRTFAYDTVLAGMARHRLTEDRNGVATKGLMFMEDTWDTCYLWENAEAVQAYFQAAVETEAFREEYERAGLTILRAIARHHHGNHGFLTEGIDWNNAVGAQHHIDGAEFGAIQYTEPLLNNVHIVTPTLYYLEQLAVQRHVGDSVEYRDMDGNLLTTRAVKAD
jgi:hypothetical protein